MATLVSRITGFARTVLLAAVLGVSAVADAYNGANVFPNMVYSLLLGGVLSSVVVPVLAQSRLRSRVVDDEFVQRFLAVVVFAAFVLTTATVVAAPVLAAFFVDAGPQRDLTRMWAYFFLPQVFFYAVAALVTAVLNVRGRFGAPSWAPVINNLIVIGTLGLFVIMPGPTVLSPTSLSAGQILVLGAGTTLGIVGQAAWCVLLLRRTGFRWRWRVRLVPYTMRPVRVGVRMTAWLLVYVAASQIGVTAVTRVAFDHNSVSTFAYADLLIQLPYGVVAVSILTVLAPRMARAAASVELSYLRAELRRGARYLLALLIPIAGAFVVLAPTVSTLMFTGRVATDDAALIGNAVAASMFGLPALAVVMLQLRACYSVSDTRTPALINILMVAIKVTVIAVGITLTPGVPALIVLCVSGSVSYVVGAIAGHLVLRHRYGLLGFRRVAETGARSALNTALAALAALAGMWTANQTLPLPPSFTRSALLALTAATVGMAVFGYLLRIVRIPEITRTSNMVRQLART
ncbi:murein biosynthesis integral membrane protein MurJ [Gordonia zhaorongruii]|uniref:murein biosynthesis integral membrane protein MurJ n=1 Tax=Gordonia zhaorongruii TaxID=2597659 RepID=UPI0014052816|nr:lipid II flippase MurJ [Gordonia zhaorongruii]